MDKTSIILNRLDEHRRWLAINGKTLATHDLLGELKEIINNQQKEIVNLKAKLMKQIIKTAKGTVEIEQLKVSNESLKCCGNCNISISERLDNKRCCCCTKDSSYKFKDQMIDREWVDKWQPLPDVPGVGS
jgi:hypothetical protein